MKKRSRWSRNSLSCLSRLLLLLAFDASASRAASAADDANGLRELILRVTLNQAPLREDVTVATDGRTIWLPAEVFAGARLALPAAPPVVLHGTSYYPADAAGIGARIDEPTQTLDLNAPAPAFAARQYALANRDRLEITPAAAGGFLNYDLNRLHAEGAGGPAADTSAGMFEVGAFSDAGTLTSRHVLRAGMGGRRTYRIDTRFARDFPDRAASLVAGDSVSGASAWSRRIYFGGLQWHSDFAMRPDLQPLLLPSLAGQAAAPSVVDIYIDNVLRARQPVDAGPFAINDLPVLTGQGEIQAVVRDVLGRQQVVTQAYVASPTLLKPGMADFSGEVGALREAYGQPDAGYGRPFASATARRGLSNRLTLELHGEAQPALQAAGLGGAFPLAGGIAAGAGVAFSRSTRGDGALAYLQVARQGAHQGFSTRIAGTSAGFGQLGLAAGEKANARELQAQWSVALRADAALALGYLDQGRRGMPSFRAVNARWNLLLARQASLSFGVARALFNDRSLQVNATLSLPLGRDAVAQLAATRQPGGSVASADYQAFEPFEGGWGYRLRKSAGTLGGVDAGVSYGGDTGSYAAGVGSLQGRTSVQLQARGGVGFLDRHALATRWIDDSFALVDAPLPEPVALSANNRVAGHTNRNGFGIVTGLASYAANRIAIDDARLPLDAILDGSETTVVPKPRTGVVVRFGVRQVSGATLELRDESGAPLPPGTVVSINDPPTVYETGLKGMLFVTDLHYPAHIHATTDAGPCSVTVEARSDPRPLPRLGSFVCRREAR